MDLDKMREGMRSKLHRSDEHIDGAFIDAAILNTLEKRAGLSGDALYAHAVKRAKEMSEEYETLTLPHTSTDRILGDAIVRSLAPKIEQLRIAGFGGPSAPFSTIPEAVAWIEDEGEKARAWMRERNEEGDAALKEIQRLADEHGLEVEEKKHALLTYQKEDDDHAKSAFTILGSYPRLLARETRSMAKHTGLAQDALTMHVLTGMKPKRGRARIATRRNWYTLPSGEQIHTNEATVTFRALDLTDEELRKVYGYIRGGTGGKGTEGLTEKHEYLWTLVQNAGGPPSKHGEKGKFWQRIREKLAAKYPDAPRTNNGIEGSYNRILGRYKLS